MAKKIKKTEKKEPILINTVNLKILKDEKRDICDIKDIGMKTIGEFQIPIGIRGTVKDIKAGELQRKLDMMGWELGKLRKTSNRRVFRFNAKLRDDTVMKFYDPSENMVFRIRMKAFKDDLVTIHRPMEKKKNVASN